MRTTRTICVVIFVVLLWAPMFQRLTKVFPGTTLYGVEKESGKPALTARTWWDGTYQVAQEKHLAEQIGFRGSFIRTHNQVSLSVFNRIPGDRGTQIVRGTDNWLYERDYLDERLSPMRTRDRQREGAGRELARLQALLAERGITLLLLISPSKVEICPEHLPAEVRRAVEESNTPSNRELLLPVLERYGVRLLDANALFHARKDTAQYPFFAKGGTHWNSYGACIVLRAVLDELRPTTESLARVPCPDCEAMELRPSRGTDLDLANLLNTWVSTSRGELSPYPAPVEATVPFEERPGFLIVGDSFAFTIAEQLRNARVSGPLHLLYYFKRLYTYPANDELVEQGRIENRAVTAEELDWETLLLDKKVVIVEVNEIILPLVGWGFLERASEELERLKAQP